MRIPLSFGADCEWSCTQTTELLKMMQSIKTASALEQALSAYVMAVCWANRPLMKWTHFLTSLQARPLLALDKSACNEMTFLQRLFTRAWLSQGKCWLWFRPGWQNSMHPIHPVLHQQCLLSQISSFTPRFSSCRMGGEHNPLVCVSFSHFTPALWLFTSHSLLPWTGHLPLLFTGCSSSQCLLTSKDAK